MKNNPVVKMVVATVIAFFAFAAVVTCGIYMNYMEYLEIGTKMTSVFWVDFNAKALTVGISFVIFFIVSK